MGSVAHPLVSIISEKLIKPSSPTCPTKRWHKLSLIDQAFSNSYIPFSLFYTKHQLDHAANNIHEISQLLEESLSKLLSIYHPYAGRLKDNTTIDCNDAGAEFIQVQIDCLISQTLKWHNSDIEDLLFPQGLPWSNCANRALVVVQLNYFNCGGIAITMCISHKIGDGCSAYNLFRDWSHITRDPINFSKPSLHYAQQSIFPPPSSCGPLLSPLFMSNKHDCVQRRFIFSNDKLLNLKNTVSAESEVQNPTRTEVVSALIFKCAVGAAKANSGIFQPPSMVQAFDLRAQVGLPPNAIGNILTISPTPITNEESMTISKLVIEMRKSKELVYKRDNVKDNMFVALLLELAKSKQEYHDNGPNAYQITSVVKFALHEIDFGWGKPTKVSIANGLNNKLAILMANQSGGLEALVTLTQQDMSVFERDPELLQFASSVPTC